MTRTRLAALATTATVALSGLVPAAGVARATHAGQARVSPASTYVYVKPGILFTGTMFKRDTFKVERFSPSGKWAYGMAYGHVNRHAWISASALDQR